MTKKCPNPMFLRLPQDLRLWVADEALRGRRSMNSLLVEAVDFFRGSRSRERRDHDHSAAIEQAISLARLPQSTSIIMRSGHHEHETEILIQTPSNADLVPLARVSGQEVTFATDAAIAAANADAQFGDQR